MADQPTKTEPTLGPATGTQDKPRSLGRNRAIPTEAAEPVYDELSPPPIGEEPDPPPTTKPSRPQAVPKAQPSKAVPANAGTNVDSLLVDIFELTGQKVTLDDPLVVAALIQSTMVKRAGAEAADSLRDAVVKIVADLAEAVKVERQVAANLDKTLAGAFQQITDGAKKAGDQEVTAMQMRFSRAATETLDLVRKEAAKQNPQGLWWKLSAMALGGVALGLLVGTLLAKGKSAGVTQEQVRLIHNGILLDAAWPKLPKQIQQLIQSGDRQDAKPADTGKVDKKP